MLKKEMYAPFLPEDLAAQIEGICNCFRDIKYQALDIASHSVMPDANAQLNDVLQYTEDATIRIIDTVNAIRETVSSGSPADVSAEVEGHVAKIYELCNFQDISGQRIKKVLNQLHQLEERLTRLSQTLGGQPGFVALTPAATSDGMALMNGPQLAADAPTQDEVDKLFSAAGGSPC